MSHSKGVDCMSYQISDKLCFGFLLQKERPFSDTDVFMVKDAVFGIIFKTLSYIVIDFRFY